MSYLTGQVVTAAAGLVVAKGRQAALIVGGEAMALFYDLANTKWVSPAIPLVRTRGSLVATTTADITSFFTTEGQPFDLKKWTDAGLTAQIEFVSRCQIASGSETATLGIQIDNWDAAGAYVSTVSHTADLLLTKTGDTNQTLKTTGWVDYPDTLYDRITPYIWGKTSNAAQAATFINAGLRIRFRK